MGSWGKAEKPAFYSPHLMLCPRASYYVPAPPNSFLQFPLQHKMWSLWQPQTCWMQTCSSPFPILDAPISATAQLSLVKVTNRLLPFISQVKEFFLLSHLTFPGFSNVATAPCKIVQHYWEEVDATALHYIYVILSRGSRNWITKVLVIP